MNGLASVIAIVCGACSADVPQIATQADGRGDVVSYGLGPGNPVVLAAHQINPAAIAVRDGTVFWTTWHREGMIQSVSREGGEPRILAAGLNAPGAIAVSGDRVFWTCTLDDWQTDVSSVSRNGGVLEVFASGPPEPYQLATDARSLYWITKDSVMKMPLRGGGQPSVIATGLHVSNGVAVDSGIVYFTDEEKVMKVAETGGPIDVLASGQQEARAIATDASNVYWVSYGTWLPKEHRFDGGVWKMPKDHGKPTLLAAANGPNTIAVDGEHVYWTEEDTVARVPKSGGSPTVLASAQEIPLGIALDDVNVYWTTASNSGTQGTVAKLEKQVARRPDSSASAPH